MQDWQALLFSFDGRIPRTVFWVAQLAAGVVIGVLTALLISVAMHAGAGMYNPSTRQFRPAGPYAIAMFILSLAQIWIGLALTVKRLHDRNRTGWWIVAQMAAGFAAIAMVSVTLAMPAWQQGTGFALSAVIGGIALGLTLWLLIETGLLPGTPGENRFGPEPLPSRAKAGS